MEKLIRDGKVAVLVSRGYGAGWSTWNYANPEMLFDPVIAQMLLDEKSGDEIVEYGSKKYPDAYFGGVDGLYVKWIPQGTLFRIDEYDGAESVECSHEVNWKVA